MSIHMHAGVRTCGEAAQAQRIKKIVRGSRLRTRRCLDADDVDRGPRARSTDNLIRTPVTDPRPAQCAPQQPARTRVQQSVVNAGAARRTAGHGLRVLQHKRQGNALRLQLLHQGVGSTRLFIEFLVPAVLDVFRSVDVCIHRARSAQRVPQTRGVIRSERNGAAGSSEGAASINETGGVCTALRGPNMAAARDDHRSASSLK